MTHIDPTWSLEREIVLSKVLDAPRELVFAAWMSAEHLCRWFGPEGFGCNTHEMEAKVGGRWRFDLVAPNGHVFDNRVVFLQIEPPSLLVFDHGRDVDDDPDRFRVTLTFDEQSNKKTVLTLRQLHPTAERRSTGIGFGAVELGYQTLDKLGRFLAEARV